MGAETPTWLPAAQRRAPPQRVGRVAAPRVLPSGASSWPPARPGPWAAPGRWLGEGRKLSGPAEWGCFGGGGGWGGGHTRFQHPLLPQHWPRAARGHPRPGAGSFFPPFSPLEQRRRKGSCSLASPDAGGSGRRRRRRGSRAQRSGFSGPAPKPGPAPRSLQHPGSPAPHPWRPSLHLTSGRAALAPARRAESLGSRLGAGGLMDRGRRRRAAVAGAARVLAGRNGSRSTSSSRSCSPLSPPFSFSSSSAAASRQPREDAREREVSPSACQPVRLRAARRGSHRGGGGGSGSIAPPAPPPALPAAAAAAGLGLAPGSGLALRAGAALRRGGSGDCGRALRCRGRGCS